MRMSSTVILLVVITVLLLPFSVAAEPAVLLETVPTWNIGDSWKYHIDKDLDRTVTQGMGTMQVSMKLDNITSTLSFTVAGITTVDGEECYATRISGEEKITGSYSAMQLQDDLGRGSLTQQAKVNGTEYRRVRDLAFVKAEMRQEGTIQLGGGLGGIPTPFQAVSVSTANPPAEILRFPLVEGDSWNISTVLNTAATGASSESIITTFNYTCRVVGTEQVTLANGETYDCIAIAQEGKQTIQSQASGISIENIKGSLFFAPLIGNRVKDDAEGEELVEYVPGGGPAATETTEATADVEPQPRPEPAVTR